MENGLDSLKPTILYNDVSYPCFIEKVCQRYWHPIHKRAKCEHNVLLQKGLVGHEDHNKDEDAAKALYQVVQNQEKYS